MSDTHDCNHQGSPNTTSYTQSFLNSLRNTPTYLASHSKNVALASPRGTIQGAKTAPPGHLVLYITGTNGVESTKELHKNSTDYHNLLEYCDAYPASDGDFPPNTNRLVGTQLWQSMVTGNYSIPNRVTRSGTSVYKLKGSLNTFFAKVSCIPFGVLHGILMGLIILQFLSPSLLISAAILVNFLLFLINIIFKKSPWHLEKQAQ